MLDYLSTSWRNSYGLFSTLLPFYIKSQGHIEHTTYIIMVLYICSIVASSNTSKMSMKVGRRRTMMIGVTLSVIASVLLFLNQDILIFLLLAASFIGFSQAIIMNSVINYICDVIGGKSDKGASVFGIYSFTDKIITGLVVYLATLPKTLDSQQRLEYIILLVPSSLGILSCLWVFMTTCRPKHA